MKIAEIFISVLFVAVIFFVSSVIVLPSSKMKKVDGFVSIISAQENNRLLKPTPTLAVQEIRFGRSLIPETTLIK